MTDQYHVYHHIYDGKIFYVGMGKGRRAFSSSERTRRWKDYVASIPRDSIFEVRIVRSFADEHEASVFEKSEIKRLHPITNLSHTTGKPMTTAEAGALGAAQTNKLLTPEKRRRAAKKGWRLRKQRLQGK